MTPNLPSKMVDLLDRASSTPGGLPALLDGHLESLAALYQAHPFDLEALRVKLADPEVRRLATEYVDCAKKSAGAQGRASRSALLEHLPAEVVMGECWARDGLQSEPAVVPTAAKVELIAGMVDAGFKRIEATSFAHPKYLPQFADAEKVLELIPRKAGVQYRGICTTPRAVERAVASKQAGYGVDEVAMVISASERHNKANVDMTHAENQRQLEQMARRSLDTGHEVFGWVLTAFGCPITGDVPMQKVIELGRWWKDLGARYIGFGDTVGVANPRQVAHFYEEILAAGFTRDEVVVHFHDTRGWGVANTLAALTFGFRYVDSSLGAIGGQPKTGAASYHRGHTGNTCTEDLVGMLEEMGVATGVDHKKLIALGGRAEEVIGRKLRSNYLMAGPVPHQGIAWDKSKGITEPAPLPSEGGVLSVHHGTGDGGASA